MEAADSKHPMWGASPKPPFRAGSAARNTSLCVHTRDTGMHAGGGWRQLPPRLVAVGMMPHPGWVIILVFILPDPRCWDGSTHPVCRTQDGAISLTPQQRDISHSIPAWSPMAEPMLKPGNLSSSLPPMRMEWVEGDGLSLSRSPLAQVVTCPKP